MLRKGMWKMFQTQEYQQFVLPIPNLTFPATVRGVTFNLTSFITYTRWVQSNHPMFFYCYFFYEKL